MPPFRWEYLGETFQSAGILSVLVFTMGNGEVGAAPSVGSPQGLATFAEMTHEYLSPPDGSSADDYPLGRVEGWVAARSGSLSLKVIPHTQQAITQSITTMPAPDVTLAHPGAKTLRFSLESNCPVLECDLAVILEGGQVLIPFRALIDGVPLDTPTLMVSVYHATGDEDSSLADEHGRALQSVAGHGLQKQVAFVIARAYAKSFLTLTLLAICGLIIALATIRQQRPSTPGLAIVVASLVAIASRIMLLAYIDAVSFPTEFLHYCSPASPFAIIFVVLGIYLGWPELRWNRGSPDRRIP